jgi:hypothetical protein
MLLSQFIQSLETSKHPNVIQLLPLLKQNLKQYGDVKIDLEVRRKKCKLINIPFGYRRNCSIFTT